MLPGFVCFFVGLLYELEMGIFTGVGTHLVIVLYNSARPRVRVDIKQVMMVKKCDQIISVYCELKEIMTTRL